MAFVRYIAKRSLSSGHSADTEYTIEFNVRQSVRSRSPTRSEQRAMNGAKEVIYYSAEEVYQVETTLQDEADLDLWREFLDSVEDGQEFGYDDAGTVSTPVNELQGTIQGRGRETRVEPSYWRFGFTFERTLV
jgi:hypothetical protein